MGLIFFLSHQHSLPTPSLFPGQDKLFHGITFGVLGAFYLGSMRKSRTGYSLPQAAIASLYVLAYGASDETHQYFVPGRTTEYMDVAADAVGGLLMITIVFLIARRRSRSPRGAGPTLTG